ncbi:MAG: hypothetical protein J5781_00805, partial [Clostridia bacterium]|nr:hypothetical protein [Clostridia bacterium]
MKKKNIVTKYKFVCFFVILLVFSTGLILSASPKESAYAARQKALTIEQTQRVVFCGDNYINASGVFCDTNGDEAGFNNDLFDSFIFKLDGQPIDVSVSDVRV